MKFISFVRCALLERQKNPIRIAFSDQSSNHTSGWQVHLITYILCTRQNLSTRRMGFVIHMFFGVLFLMVLKKWDIFQFLCLKLHIRLKKMYKSTKILKQSVRIYVKCRYGTFIRTESISQILLLRQIFRIYNKN